MALATTAAVFLVARGLATVADTPAIERGRVAPEIVGQTLDGRPFRLSELRGKPVIVNFWGPGCVPCRDEFPLFKAKLAEHAGDGLTIVGVLMNDPPEPARDFVTEFGATWPTVNDPNTSIRSAYRVAARPQTYFIDREGILRSIQIGEVREADFDRQYALIGP
ncbi:MAG: redoxin domain-containing protein [Chloroflexi bacterium]|nr:redoxin domain-containing protein [Chloroflexota bacterium]